MIAALLLVFEELDMPLLSVTVTGVVQSASKLPDS